ncbi:hypothetical protein HJC23_013575 [Cyclotella cryptica]|uniref:Uncharacterized protein n=1 Tax=Cyclotella cryptica TaxID=29204 RepID=A0ABD3PQF3_9STRA|eukprot:CCRYP_012286-RA/>CCRYP_012286-RA protein AED:0.26 eAED:0.26 QI:0/-1/0/1/-1/1/1/0/302
MLLNEKQHYRRKYWLPFLSLIPSVLSFQPCQSLSSPPLISNARSAVPPVNNNVGHCNYRKLNESRRNQPPSSSSLHTTVNDNTVSPDDTSSTTSPTKVYFDIAINTTPLGRLTFLLTPPSHPSHLPLHTANFLSLASSQRRSIDPKATYRGCTFQYSPSTIEDGSMRYRWGHVCEGYGRSGLASAKSGEVGSDRLQECKHNVFGGMYYGMAYQEVLRRIQSEWGDDDDVEKEAVLMTVPNGISSKFSIVRVSESPKEWGERLLINSVVLGYLDCGDGSSLDVLRGMARQRVGPPKIVDCGVI